MASSGADDLLYKGYLAFVDEMGFGNEAMSRLVSVYSGADSESFQYDANGNRLAQTGVLNAFSATSNRLVSSGTTQYGYDAKGNTTTVNATPTYHYDAFNRMDGAGGMTYYVNPEGQRMRKSGAVGTTYFAYGPGGTLLAENVNGAWIDYVWLNGRLIGRLANGQTYAIHADQTGRPETVTDASRTVVWQAQNLAFTRNVTKANITLNIGFPGQYYDAETDKWNNGYRDYDARLGRYVESDPIGLMGGVNTYAYAGGDPISFVDPLGLTQGDIDCLFAVAKEREVDLKFPNQLQVRDLGGGKVGYTNYFSRAITVDDRYLAVLAPAQLTDLYDTIVHEGLHLTRGMIYSALNHPKIYDEAARRTEAVEGSAGGKGCDC